MLRVNPSGILPWLNHTLVDSGMGAAWLPTTKVHGADKDIVGRASRRSISVFR